MIELPICTERLTIRRFQRGDWEAFLQFMLDTESTRYLALSPEQRSSSGAESLFDAVLSAYDSLEPIHAYAIADRVSALYVGSCGYAAYDDGVVECYFSVNRPFRRKGIAAEATSALLAALSPFAEVRAYCHADNIAAHSVAIKCGMVHRGPARHKHTALDGQLFVFAKC